MQRLEVVTTYIEPGNPWENGYIESFNGNMRDEFLNREIFDTLKEIRILIERWRQEYNTIRQNSALGYKSPAPVEVTRILNVKLTFTDVVKLGYGQEGGNGDEPDNDVYRGYIQGLGLSPFWLFAGKQQL